MKDKDSGLLPTHASLSNPLIYYVPGTTSADVESYMYQYQCM